MTPLFIGRLYSFLDMSTQRGSKWCLIPRKILVYLLASFERHNGPRISPSAGINGGLTSFIRRYEPNKKDFGLNFRILHGFSNSGSCGGPQKWYGQFRKHTSSLLREMGGFVIKSVYLGTFLIRIIASRRRSYGPFTQ